MEDSDGEGYLHSSVVFDVIKGWSDASSYDIRNDRSRSTNPGPSTSVCRSKDRKRNRSRSNYRSRCEVSCQTFHKELGLSHIYRNSSRHLVPGHLLFNRMGSERVKMWIVKIKDEDDFMVSFPAQVQAH